MHLEKAIGYPAPPDRVAALLADPAFVAEVCQASGARSWDVDVRGGADGAFTVTSTRVLPADDLPDAARRLLGSTITVHEVDDWQAAAADGSRAGTLTLSVPGAPVSARAALSLQAGPDGGSAQVVTGEIKASVPLVGRRIEQAAMGPLLAALDQLEQLAGRHLQV